MKLQEILNYGEYLKNGIKTNYYTESRFKELTKKGYTNNQIKDLINFELGLNFVISNTGKNAVRKGCFAKGAELGALATFELGPIATFIGTGLGGYGAEQLCNFGIDTLTEKGLQKISEDLYKQNKDDRNKDIDLTKIKTYISARKTYIQKPGSEIRSKKEYISNPRTRNLYDVLMNLPAPTGFASDIQDKTENKFSGYLNPISSSPKIFTREDIGKMSTNEYLYSEKEINAQLNSIGIPRNVDMEFAANSGDVIYVNSYTRDDGTKVRGYYRSKPRF